MNTLLSHVRNDVMVACDWSATLDHVTTLRVPIASTRRILLKASSRQNSVRLDQCPLDRAHRRRGETVTVVHETEKKQFLTSLPM